MAKVIQTPFAQRPAATHRFHDAGARRHNSDRSDARIFGTGRSRRLCDLRQRGQRAPIQHILGQVKAEKMGYSQVLWLDGEHRKYVEEVGTMNIMFKIAGEIYTAPIEGTVLPGVTRDSMIHLLRDWASLM